MFTSKVWTDASKLLQESNLTSSKPHYATSRHSGHYQWVTCPKSLRGGQRWSRTSDLMLRGHRSPPINHQAPRSFRVWFRCFSIDVYVRVNPHKVSGLSVPFARTTLMTCKYALFALMTHRCGMAFLLSCASYLRRFPTHSIVVLKLFFLTVLESGAPLSSSGLEDAR